ncbi:MAG: hypothetical protein AAF383_09295 [Cyanobacteria bacterium P01_A01_bin.83]
MESKKLEFIQLIDHALKIVEQTKSQNQIEQLNNLTGVLQTIKSQALADQLEPSQGISTLGLSRGVADWVDSLDSPLLKAVGAIEQHYQKHL